MPNFDLRSPTIICPKVITSKSSSTDTVLPRIMIGDDYYYYYYFFFLFFFFFATKAGDYSREAIISTIAHIK